MKTFNKAPSSVKQYGYDDLNYQFFNHSNWKGLCDNKNYIGVDQETFEECNNVYIDENALLSSRPAIKRDKHFDKLLTVDGVTYQISNAYPFTDELIVLEYKKDNQKYLKFVNSNYSENVQFYIGIDNYKLVDEDNKIFIFADNVFAYYDKSNNIVYSDNSGDPDNKQQALDKIYVPTTKSWDGTKYANAESPNEFTPSELTSYSYTNTSTLPNDLIGKTVILQVGNKAPYQIDNWSNDYFKTFTTEKFILDNSARLPANSGYTPINTDMLYPMLWIDSYGNMIMCKFTTLPNKNFNTMADIQADIYYSTTGQIFTKIVACNGTLTSLPVFIKDGTGIAYVLTDGNIHLTKFDGSPITTIEVPSNGTTYILDDYPKLTALWRYSLDFKSESKYCYMYANGSDKTSGFSVCLNGNHWGYLPNLFFIANKTSYTVTTNGITIPNVYNNFGYRLWVTKDSANNAWLLHAALVTKYGNSTSSEWYTYDDTLYVDSYSETNKFALKENEVSIINNIPLNNLNNNGFNTGSVPSSLTSGVKITLNAKAKGVSNGIQLLPAEDGYFSIKVACTGAIGWYEPVLIQYYSANSMAIFQDGALVRAYAYKSSSVAKAGAVLASTGILPQSYSTLYYSIITIPSNVSSYSNDSGKVIVTAQSTLITNTNKYTWNWPATDNIITTDPPQPSVESLGEYAIVKLYNDNTYLSNYNLYENGNKYTYNSNNVKTNLPIAYAPYVGDSDTSKKYIYYVDKDGKVYSSRISEDTLVILSVKNSIDTKINHIVPTAITKLNAYYFAKGNKLYISAQGSEVPTGEFKWYFPKINTQLFVDNITNLHPISKDDVAIFFDDHINYVHRETSEDKTLYYYYTSKIQLGCRLGNTILTTFDGKYITFATKRGIVALSYQNFVATDEQTLTYLSDNIFAIYDKWNASAIKLLQYKYWIICYRQDNETAYVYDLRNNSWWPITYDISTKIFVFKNKLHIVSDNDIFVLDTAYNNYKDTKGNISWKIKSQKLHFNALNYYKHINNITLNNVADDGVCTMTLKLKAYRKVMNESKDLVFDIPINFIRTFVKHLSILKTNEFQYQLTSDDTVALNSPLRLSNITIKYKITGQVR